MTDLIGTPPIPQARVLVVDDEARMRSALVRSLTLLGYSVDDAASGPQALEVLERTPYDVMVLDLRMPGMGGVEVMQRACQMCPDLSIIVLTGHATLESAISAVRSRAADYLLKPASVHDVAAAIASALQRRTEKLHRQHLFHVMDQALGEMREVEALGERPPMPSLGRFLRAGPVTLYREKRLVVVAQAGDAGGFSAELTVSEDALLAYLMQRPGAVLSCRELARSALGYEIEAREARNIIRPHICRLRRKIEPDPAQPYLIRTVPGRGYAFAP